MRRLRPVLSYANLTATLALVVALTGGAYAAARLPRNSVSTHQLAPGAVRAADIAADAVTSSKVKDGSLLAADFKAGQLPSGPQGPQGPQGIQGPKGDPGATRVVAREVVDTVAGGSFADKEVHCLAGEALVGGGGGLTVAGTRSYGSNHFETQTYLSTPITAAGAPADGDSAAGWRLSVQNNSGSPRDLHVYALCAQP